MPLVIMSGLVWFLVLTVVGSNSEKRQLSPAVSLANRLHPLVSLINDDDLLSILKKTNRKPEDYNDLAITDWVSKDDANTIKRRLASSQLGLNGNGILETISRLQEMGKRHLDPQTSTDRHFEMLSTLKDVYRKRKKFDSFSPAIQLEDRLRLTNLQNLGRR